MNHAPKLRPRRAPRTFVLAALALLWTGAGCAHGTTERGSVAAAAAAPAPLQCVRPTVGGGALHLTLAVPPFSGFARMCDELAAFVAVPPDPNADEVAQARRALATLGTLAEARCVAPGGGEGLHCALSPTTVVRSYHIAGYVPFALFTDDLRRRLTLRPGTVLHDETGQLAAQTRRLEGYLRQEGYFDAAVALTARPARGAEPQRGVHLDVAVTSRKTVRVRHVELTGQVPLPTEALARRFFHRGPLGISGRFRPLQLAEDVEQATLQLHRAGFVGARVAARYDVHPEAHAVDLTLNVHAGPKVRLRLEGERVLSERALRALSPYAESGTVDAVATEQLRRAVLQRAQERGYARASVQASIGRGIEPHTRVVTLAVDTAGGRRAYVRRLRLLGARRVPAAQLLEETTLLQRVSSRWRRRPLVQAHLDHDVEALRASLLQRGFFAAKAHAEHVVRAGEGDEEDSVEVTYAVDEGPVRRLGEVGIEVEGDEVLQERLGALLALAPGEPCVDDAVDGQAQALQLALAQWGYVGADVQVRRVVYDGATPDPSAPAEASAAVADAGQRLRHPRDERVDVAFVVAAGERTQLAGTFVRGNFRTRTATLRQEMGLHPPEPLGIGRLGAAKRALRATNLFDTAELTPVRAVGQEGNTWLVLAVEERDVRSVDGVASFSSDYRFALGADFRDANLFGRAVQLGLTARLSDAANTVPHLRIGNQDLLEARLRAPHPFGLPLLFEASTRYRYRDIASYRSQYLGATAEVSRTFFAERPCALCPSMTMRFGYEISSVYLHYKAEESPRSNATIARLRPSIGFDARDALADPRRGYNLDVQLEGAHPALAGPLGARSTSFWRLLPSAQVFVPLGTPLRVDLSPQRALGGPLVLAVGASFRSAGPFGRRGGVPSTETTGFGGDLDVRGMQNNGSSQLLRYPDYVVTGSVELRWYLLEQFGFGSVQLAGFVDAGAVADTLRRLGSRGVVSAGPTLRYVTPVGPLSLAYGYAFVAPAALRSETRPGAPKRGRFHFTFGYTF